LEAYKNTLFFLVIKTKNILLAYF